MLSLQRLGMAGLAVGFVSFSAMSQELYDIETLRTFNITFHDANWEQLLRDNYFSETPILADLEIDGDVYPDVGVRIRGNTSYWWLPPGSQKFSLKIYTDFTDPDQEVMSYDTLNLNNAFHDPTFCREVVYNNYVSRFIPHPRANHVLVTLNGQNWGVYVNTQQPDKRMLRDYFADNDGMRIKCANNPNGPGLRYFGTNPGNYSDYEMQNDGGLADPWDSFITVCDAVTNWPIATWENIDTVFAIDPSIWSVVLENMLSDDDSYVNKGCDIMTYTNPIDARLHLLQRDANETLTHPNWSVTHNFNSSSKPVLSHVLDVPELRQRYMAHYRTAAADLDWGVFGPELLAMRDRIDAHVQADPKKIYTYQNFVDNFFTTVNLGGGGPGGGSVIGLQQFFDQRETLVAGHAEVWATAPVIGAVEVSATLPDIADDVWITAEVSPGGSPVSLVELFFREDQSGVYLRVPMADDGASNDGAAGDGVYGALLPVNASPGQRVDYYVGATAANAFESVSFMPELTEYGPLAVDYAFGAGGVRITEWGYSLDSGEFVEFTNLTDAAIDMAGWSYDDSAAVAGAFDLSAFGSVAAGESVVLTEADAEAFRVAWGLDASVKIIGELGVTVGHNLGRNDEINLFDDAGDLVDRLTYGDEDIPGSIRTRDATGQACLDDVGTDNALAWLLSVASDAFGSFAASTGEFGTPGSYDAAACDDCPADINGDGILDLTDVQLFITAFTAGDLAADMNGDGILDLADVQGFVVSFTAGCG